MKQHPRYNIISCRISDETKASVEKALSGRSVQEFLHAALEEKLINDRQAWIDAYVSSLR
ncbi:MAG TPA: hypothetical protein HPP94_08720 [Desulfuromonadales bacterium]|nr:hypothetical protein [Desulfuromonadales bacterium]